MTNRSIDGWRRHVVRFDVLLLLAMAVATFAAPAHATPPPAADTAALAPRMNQVPGLEGVTVRRYDRVVVLEGKVGRDTDRDLAIKIAAAEDGVVEVVDDIAVSVSARDRVADWQRESARRLSRILSALPLLVLAVAIVGLFWWLGRRLTRMRWHLLRPSDSNPFLMQLVSQGIRLAFVLIGLLIALQLLDAMALATALVGSAGVIGLAVGFALRNLAENYIASILLSLKQPFAPHDEVVIDGNEGFVVGLNSRSTLLMTRDGNHLRLPNAMVFKAVILNYTRNGQRRFIIELSLAPDARAEIALRAGLAALQAVPGVLADPKPWARITEAGSEWLRVSYAGWVDQTDTDVRWCRAEAFRLVRRALRDSGIDLQRPVQPLLQRPSIAEPPDEDQAAPPDTGRRELSEAVAKARQEMGSDDLLSQAAPRE